MSFLDVNSQVTPHYGMRPRDRQRSLAVFNPDGEAIGILLLNGQTIDIAHKLYGFRLELDRVGRPGAIYNFHARELVFFSDGSSSRELPQLLAVCTHGDEELIEHIDFKELANYMNTMLPQGIHTIRMRYQERMSMYSPRPKF